MAMNKKEQAAFDALQTEAGINRALRWSDVNSVQPDIAPPEEGYINGWLFNSFTKCVYKAWSGVTVHGDGSVVNGVLPKTASQHAVHLYSTEKLALRAMRCELEREYANNLAKIDRMTKSQFHKFRSRACVKEAFRQHAQGATGLADILAACSREEIKKPRRNGAVSRLD